MLHKFLYGLGNFLVLTIFTSCGFTHKTVSIETGIKNKIGTHLAQEKVVYLNSYNSTIKQYSSQYKYQIDTLGQDSIYGTIYLTPVTFHKPNKKKFRHAYFYEVNGEKVVRDSLDDPIDVLHLVVADTNLSPGQLNISYANIYKISTHQPLEKETWKSMIVFGAVSTLLVFMVWFMFSYN